VISNKNLLIDIAAF